MPVIKGNIVKGPVSATDNALARYDGATGKLVQNSNATLSDDGVLTTITDNEGHVLRAATAEAGSSIDFWKHPTSSSSLQRLGQFTGHGTGVGSLANEMAWYTTDSLGAMQNRMKFWSLTDDSPLILTGATGIAKTSGALIKLGEDVIGGGTSKVKTENDLGVRISPVSRLHVYEDTTGTGTSAGITVEQDGSGDAVIQFLLTALQRWVIGIDNSDSDKFKIAANSDVGSSPLLSMDTSGNTTFAGDVTVPDEVYGAGWNGSLEAPTKNAVYDKIETIAAGSGITRTVTVTSGSFTAGSSASVDYVYLIAGAHTPTMPAATGLTNRWTFKNNHSADITIGVTGADTIEGASSLVLPTGHSVDLIGNGTSAYYVI